MMHNHFALADIENALGLGSTVNTIQNTQKALDNLNPQINWVDQHLPQILIGWFLLTILAAFLGSKLAK